MGFYNINGELVADREAAIPVTDLGVLRGMGVFDFLRTYGGRPFYLTAHLKRLKQSAKFLGLFCPWSLEVLQEMVMETLEKNGYEESNIRIVITGGDSPDFFTPGEDTRVIVLVTELVPMPTHWYREGVKVVTARLDRYIPEAKSTNYIKAIVAMAEARKSGAVESLYVNDEGQVFEGTTSNLFMVKDSKIITPDQHILEGVTRKVVIELAREVRGVEARPITYKELVEADELFLTASNKEVVPIIQVDEVPISAGNPGLLTVEVMDMFREFTEKYGQGLIKDDSLDEH